MPDSTTPTTPTSPTNATVNGTTGNDTLSGSGTWGAGSDGSWQPQGSGNNTFNAGAGNDEASGGDGNDTFNMGTGSDKAFGGDGQDSFVWRAGDGNDEFHGGAGTDTVTVPGQSVADATRGLSFFNDSPSQGYTLSGNTIVFNGPSNGQITINGETLKFFGVERISLPDSTTTTTPTTPTTNNGVITGTAGNDTLSGSGTWGAGSDGSWQPQGSGNNLFNAGAGNDEAHGGDGNDTFRMGQGDDKAFGGDGQDTFFWAPGVGNDEVHGGPGQDTLTIEHSSLSTVQGGLTLYGGGSFNVVDGAIVFSGPASGQITINGQTVKFFGMERITLA